MRAQLAHTSRCCLTEPHRVFVPQIADSAPLGRLLAHHGVDLETVHAAEAYGWHQIAEVAASAAVITAGTEAAVIRGGGCGGAMVERTVIVADSGLTVRGRFFTNSAGLVASESYAIAVAKGQLAPAQRLAWERAL